MKDSISRISVDDVFRGLSTGSISLIDVRSEAEYEQGSIPGSVNLPILRNEDRHRVGLCYRQNGETAAIEMGFKLVSPSRSKLIDSWRDAIGNKFGAITCLRGGLRSAIACRWLLDSDVPVQQVESGYKGLRQALVETLDALPNLVVLAGRTGCGKTRLVRALGGIDLENAANHRGSAFGELPGGLQPSQATFENRILARFRQSARPCTYIEDESATIGKVFVPKKLRLKMLASPCVIVEEPIDKRIDCIVREYVLDVLAADVPVDVLHMHHVACVQRLHRQLGGKACGDILQGINRAYQDPFSASGHQRWVEQLIESYYDKYYDRFLAKHVRPVLFQGGGRECLEWLQQH